MHHVSLFSRNPFDISRITYIARAVKWSLCLLFSMNNARAKRLLINETNCGSSFTGLVLIAFDCFCFKPHFASLKTQMKLSGLRFNERNYFRRFSRRADRQTLRWEDIHSNSRVSSLSRFAFVLSLMWLLVPVVSWGVHRGKQRPNVLFKARSIWNDFIETKFVSRFWKVLAVKNVTSSWDGRSAERCQINKKWATNNSRFVSFVPPE